MIASSRSFSYIKGIFERKPAGLSPPEAGVSSRNFKTMVDQVAAVNILQYSLDALKAGQAVAGYLVHESPREDSHLQETIDGPVNETENLQ